MNVMFDEASAGELRRELIKYVEFTQQDTDRLARSLEGFEPSFVEFSNHFYACIDAHDDARAVISGGQEQIDRLKRTLVDWMASGISGPHGDAFVLRRLRIGRVHVQIGLPQRYMFTAMNVMRSDFHAAVSSLSEAAAPDRSALHGSLDRLFDLELAIMVESYAQHQHQRLAAAQRMSTIGQLASGIGHELRNPLGVISSSLFLMRRRIREDPSMERHLSKMQRNVKTCEDIISNLMELARERPLKCAPVDLCELLDRIVDTHESLSEIELDCGDECTNHLFADAGLLERALANLLLNSAQAMAASKGRVSIRVESDEQGCVVRVRDYGPGFPPDFLPDAFEPLTSLRPGGTGLGLSLVRRIVQRHDGHVEAANATDGPGAVVSMHFPGIAPL